MKPRFCRGFFVCAPGEVRRSAGEVWGFLADPETSPRWDRSIKSVRTLTPGPLQVGSLVETTAPSGMRQTFRLTELLPPRRVAFETVESRWFKTAALSFELTPAENGTRIDHKIVITFRFPWSILYPVLSIASPRALGADLESLRRCLDEGLDLTRAEPA